MGAKVPRPQHDGPIYLSLLLDQLETALPVLVNAPALRSTDWLALSRRLSGVRTALREGPVRGTRVTRRHRNVASSPLFQ
jgi:hypothetical protein